MKMYVTSLLAIVSVLSFFTACAERKAKPGGEGGAVETADSCLRTISPGGTPVLANDMFDGGSGEYRLVQISLFATLRAGDATTWVGGTTMVSPHAALASRESEIQTKSEIRCGDISSLPDGSIRASTRASMALIRQNGRVPIRGGYSLSSEFTLYGKNVDVSSGGSARAFPESDSQSLLERDDTRLFLRVGATRFAIRTEARRSDGRVIAFFVYDLIQ